jgi:hypothetical protein
MVHFSVPPTLFPEGQDTPTLISQFLTYPDGYIDGCDALAGCLERFSEYDIGRNRVTMSGGSASDDIDRKKKYGKVTHGGSYEKRTAKRRRT